MVSKAMYFIYCILTEMFVMACNDRCFQWTHKYKIVGYIYTLLLRFTALILWSPLKGQNQPLLICILLQRTAQYLVSSSAILLFKHLYLYGHKEQIVMSLQFISLAKITAAKDSSRSKSLHKYFRATIIGLFLRVHNNSAKESCESWVTQCYVHYLILL